MSRVQSADSTYAGGRREKERVASLRAEQRLEAGGGGGGGGGGGAAPPPDPDTLYNANLMSWSTGWFSRCAQAGSDRRLQVLHPGLRGCVARMVYYLGSKKVLA